MNKSEVKIRVEIFKAKCWINSRLDVTDKTIYSLEDWVKEKI
jgi:hypothetical protein